MRESKPSVLITGATGTVGKELTRKLSAQKVPFRAMVRSSKGAESVAALEGVDAVIGDFNDSESLALSLDGMERAFLLTNSSELAEDQQRTFRNSELAGRWTDRRLCALSAG